MDLLNTQISYVENYNSLPRPIELGKVLQAIANPTKTKPLIKQIREVEALRQSYLIQGDTEGVKAVKDTQKAPLKAKLPAFIFGAVCEGGHRAEHIISKTGIVCLDFDSDLSTSPAQWEVFRDNLIKVKYVFYTALSVSTSGVMALLQIPDPDRQSEYFEQMKQDFAGLIRDFDIQGAKLDISKGGNPAQLRFLTYDPEAKFKADFSIYDRLPRPKQTKQKQPARKLSGQSYENVFGLAVNMTKRNGLNFVPGSMHNSIWHLSNYLNSFGVSQSEAEQWIYANILPKNDIHSNCISDPYHRYSYEFGRWDFKDHRTTQTPASNPNPYTGEIFDSRGYPSDWDSVQPPDEGTNEYNEMIRLIQSEFDAEIDYSFDPDEVDEVRQPIDRWRARNVSKTPVLEPVDT
jgi:hypothetical protein